MADLVFDCLDAAPERYGVVPSLNLRLRISEVTGERIEAIALRCQIRVEPHRRRYSPQEAELLRDLFGDTARWADTVKPMQFTTVTAMVPGFTGATTLELPVPVTYDLEIASTKYFNSVSDGVIPLLLLFSGTVFSMREGRMSVQQVPWSKETSYGLPVKVWRETVDLHFPGSAWLRLDRETLNALQRYKSRHALPTWSGTVAALLEAAEQTEGSAK
ncbi:DUF6084 family protein [Amycolatopsis sp. BJA-103]|uniref:DUF6084 family protein n=1 Tax=Amycolatopsis sp. BJA-103 TaxID=1911175 RepID=UPI000C75C936|nr:DUF6084 family protein [Amycolatopsis sp. BJA-103]AUI59206.1 hypothetical protein BKN51_13940 [Amycolatopsis sp. BJA-103]PNE17347.1 hypothetical protein B1H26_20585 [Amycolatopsis sp. BJA-103]